MDKQNFDNNRKKLTTIQKVDFEYFLKSKNDDEIAEIRGVDRSTVNKNITKIAATFGIKRDKLINDSGRDGIEKIVHRQKLLKLCLKHIPDEVTRPHIYEESGDSNPITDPAFMSKSNVNTDNRPQISINPQNIPASKSIPELTTLEFIGRKDDLTDLANLSRQAKIVLIKAEHGIGKTWLAKEFFSRHPDQYEVVQINFSLLLSEAAKAEEKLPIILKQLNQQTSGSFELNLDCLRARLLDRSQKTVAFLINNLENYLDGEHKFPEELCNYESLLRLLGDRDVNSFTLITSTREPSIQGVEISQYELRGLEIDEWRKYFSGCENAENSEVLIEMHNAYGGNAEAMRILRFTITSRFNKNIEDYWQLHRNTLLANHSLRNLISIEISWLEANNSDAYKLFCRMGFYRYQDIQTVKFKGLICLLWELPEAKRVEVVDYLSRTSLVNVFQGKYYLHPSVQEAARLCLPSDTEIYRKVHQNIAQYWKSTISGESFFGNYINIFEAFYHYYTAENYQEAFQVFSEKINTDIYEKERYAYLRYWGYSQNVASCLEQLQDNIADEHKAQLTGTIGVCYYYNNSFKKAIDFLEKAEKLISSGQDYRTIRLHSTCHSYLARANRHLGYLSKAVENCELALSHLSKIDPSKETELNKEKFYKVRINSRILRSYASVHYDLGDYQKSLERSEQALECSRNMQEDNPLEHEIGDSLAYKALALFR